MAKTETLDTFTDNYRQWLGLWILLLAISVNDWDFEYKYWPHVVIAGTLDTFIDL